MERRRQDHEEPPVVGRNGWRYHHLGIPTTIPHPEEEHLPQLKMFVRGFATSPYGIEWIRFEPDCQVHELVRSVPHIAFAVDDLNAATRGKTLLGPIGSPSDGVRVAMIIDDGAPVELIEFTRIEKRQCPSGA
jgi:hypothetical protein